MIQTQQSWLIIAFFNKENAGLWQSSFIMPSCHKNGNCSFQRRNPKDEIKRKYENWARVIFTTKQWDCVHLKCESAACNIAACTGSKPQIAKLFTHAKWDVIFTPMPRSWFARHLILWTSKEIGIGFPTELHKENDHYAHQNQKCHHCFCFPDNAGEVPRCINNAVKTLE